MAWTAAVINKGVSGSERFYTYSMTADAATQAVQTPLKYITRLEMNPNSLTAIAQIYPNKGALGTAIAGMLGCSGFTSGDVFYITVHGH